MNIKYDPQRQYILTASCPSRTGTVAKVSGYLAENRCYIMDMQQFDDVLTDRFFLRATFQGDADATPELDHLREGFLPIARDEEMEWAIHEVTRKPRVLLMVSKFDHCLDDLLYRTRTGELKMEITAIVSNHPDLEGLARWHNIPYIHLPVTKETRAEQEARLLEIVDETQSELVVLARYMQILSDDLCRKLRGRAINIHHSFLPGFKGAKPYHQAHARGVKLTGATAHYVTADLDEGPIIEQIVERVDHTFTPDMLAATGRDSECKALANAVRFHVEHRVFLNGDKTVVFK
ncbi:formyltetrahydrofolate deformylase [Azoarcus sp. KH32C]|uniref:formyltetrahydrofolate deformylase n=1 Tax=Azoarcus sp. KH32C TaxID=748247 RepID=UPI0002385D7D|nr:formyltetrahydrofolate deformylase [Azoarcus sp. KH32C]BAL27053.1 formyltetrahydrofolate deformylase [Azoarcus sp. KH32C]